MDVLPGMKTNITAVVALGFNALSMLGIVTVPEEQVIQINAGLLALISIFLGLKVERQK